MRRRQKSIILAIAAGLAATLIHAQTSNFLAQKIEIENTITSRISTAVERILGNSAFIIDVKADVEFQPERRIEEVYKPSQKNIKFRKSTEPEQASVAAQPGGMPQQTPSANAPQTDIYREILPGIPGENFEAEIPLIEELTPGLMMADSGYTVAENPVVDLPGTHSPELDISKEEDELYSRSVSRMQQNVPIIRKLDISIILQEGINPDLVESVRQVAMVAAHFDRQRGDILSIMTTAFRQNEPVAALEKKPVENQSVAVKYEPSKDEKVRDEETRKLIQEIQDQIDDLGKTITQQQINRPAASEPSATENMLLKVIDKLNSRNTVQEDIETQKLLAEQQTRLKMLAQDTSKLKNLQAEIAALKLQIAVQQNDNESNRAAEVESSKKMQEKAELENAIAEKLSLLSSTQQTIEQRDTATVPLWLWGVLGLLVIIVFILAILISRRGKAASAVSAPVTPPAPSEEELRAKILADLKKSMSREQLVRAPKTQPDPDTVDEEFEEARNSIVNLSVANPEAASALMKKWLKESAGAEENSETASEGEKSNG